MNDVNIAIQDLLLNHTNRVIRSSTDYHIITIGKLQIEGLDSRWVPSGVSLSAVLFFNPYDCMFNHIGGGTGVFAYTKYGLSYRETPLTIGSYKPLWKMGTTPDEQAKIMWQEIKKGPKSCPNGIEVTPESPLWENVDSLTTKARNIYRTSLLEKIEDFETKHIQYDGKKLVDSGVRITGEIIGLVRNLDKLISR